MNFHQPTIGMGHARTSAASSSAGTAPPATGMRGGGTSHAAALACVLEPGRIRDEGAWLEEDQMARRRPVVTSLLLLLLVAAVLLVGGCTTPTAPRPGASPVTPAPTTPATTTEQAPGVFSVSAAQAQEVAVVVPFLRASNAGRLRQALALLAADPNVSDCDYRAAEGVQFKGRAAVAGWLRQRSADHDRLQLARIFDQNPDQPVGVVGVEYQRRTSDTLRALGFRTGITPQTTKVVFTADHRIQWFVSGGSSGSCRPG
jgi:hypothetical protein